MAGFKADDYIDVAERVDTFYKDHPEGRIQTEFVAMLDGPDDKRFILFKAFVWRTPDDPFPSTGYAWEPVPGLTNFTRNAEAMNAETSAVGRAIVLSSADYGTKRDGTRSLASAQEVRNRQAENEKPRQRPQNGAGGAKQEPAGPVYPWVQELAGLMKAAQLEQADIALVVNETKEVTRAEIGAWLAETERGIASLVGQAIDMREEAKV